MRYFPTVEPLTTEFDFGLSNSGESLFLINANGQIVDSLTYSDSLPWPIEADGGGGTLVLKSPMLDNALAQNWAASPLYGSPGFANEIVTQVVDLLSQRIPDTYLLEQNYPNPFNPTTTISFQIPIRERVQLQIFDIMGREVATLLDKVVEAGVHHINWTATKNFTSGIYIYRIKVGGFSQARTMLLLK